MEALLWFAGVLMALVPLVVALVNAVADDVPDLPRWAKRCLALAFGVALAFVAEYVIAFYGVAAFPWQFTVLGGLACGLNAAGIYDISKLIGAGTSLTNINAAVGEIKQE